MTDEGLKMKKTDHDGDRTHNLPIRSRTPYPLGHAADARMEILLSHVREGKIYDLYIWKMVSNVRPRLDNVSISPGDRLELSANWYEC